MKITDHDHSTTEFSHTDAPRYGDGCLVEDALPPEHDPVNHPTHYASDAKCEGCGQSIECIEVIRHLPFTRGNAIKYLWRAGKKGATVEDLKKAIWYIQDEISQLEGTPNPNVHRLNLPIGQVTSVMEAPEGLKVEYALFPQCEFGEPRDLGRAFEFMCKTHTYMVMMPDNTVPSHCPLYETAAHDGTVSAPAEGS